MDNYLIDVICDKRPVFDAAIALAFELQRWGANPAEASHWAIKDGGFILFRSSASATESANPFPAPVGHKLAADCIWRFLESADYGKQPDHDGSNKKGFRVTTDRVERRPGETRWCRFGVVCHVLPHWCMYGK